MDSAVQSQSYKNTRIEERGMRLGMFPLQEGGPFWNPTKAYVRPRIRIFVIIPFGTYFKSLQNV